MKIGLLFSFRGAPFRPLGAAALYRAELDLMVAAEAMGYDAVWISEHHFVPDGHAVSLFPLAAAIAARTTRIRIGLQVLLLPLHDPVRVAEDAAVVDTISNGRLDLGLGVGYRPVEFDGQGIPRRERGARFEEYAPLLKRLLAEREVHHAGRFKRLSGITITPPPVQRPHPPLWMGARGETGIRRAARLGCHFVSTGHPAHRRLYLDSLVEHGRDPADFHLCQLVLAYVAESRARAWAEMAWPLHHFLRCQRDWAIEAGESTVPEEPPAPAALRRAQSGEVFGRPVFFGCAAEVTDGIAAYLERSPSTHLAVMMALPGHDPQRTRTSMARFAGEVMPHLRKSLAASAQQAGRRA